MAGKSVPKRKPSVLKRTRQAEKRNLRNRAVRSSVKTVSKNVLETLKANDKDKAEGALKTAVKTISSAVSKGVIHKNTAARKISKLAKKARAALGGAQART